MFVGGVECGAALSKDQEAKHLHHALHLLAPRTGSAVVGDDLTLGHHRMTPSLSRRGSTTRDLFLLTA